MGFTSMDGLSSNKRILIVVGCVSLVVITAGIFLWSGIFENRPKTVRQELPTPDFAIKEYSLSGKVTAIDGGSIILNVGRVFAGDNGNYVDYEDKKIIIDNKTIISKVINIDGKITIKSGVANDIKLNSNIAVYSDLDIARQNIFTPTRIDIFP